MRSTAKHVVIVRHAIGKGTATYPVSVHANSRTASAFKAQLAAAHKSGDVDTAKKLAPALKVDESGVLYPDAKWAIVELPYEPDMPVGETTEDGFEI